MATVSVIVPVYNAKQYLNQCVDSILTQTFRDFELVLVDDGSTDGSGRICDEYARADARIRVVHKKNGGVADARNKGLEAAKSNYITFVDSDDYIDSRYLEILYEMIRNYDGDLAVSYHRVIQEGERGDGEKAKGYKEEQNQTGEADIWVKVLSKAEVLKKMLENKGMITSVWGKMFHKKLFQGIHFPVGEIYEDMYVISWLVEGSRRIVGTSYAGYFYVQRGDSLTHGTPSLEHMVLLRNEERFLRLIEEKYPEISETARMHYFWSCFFLLHMLIGFPEYKREVEVLRAKIIKEWRFLLFNREVTFMQRGATLCLMPGVSFYRKVIAVSRRLGFMPPQI